MRYNLTREELLDIKRLLTLLHAEYHNPGAARHIAGSFSDCEHRGRAAQHRDVLGYT